MSQKPLVLVVEDDKNQVEAIREIVEHAGYTPIVALNGIEAFKALRKHRRGLGFLSNKIKCILLDWQMPNMNGEQFLKQLRKEEHHKTFSTQIPVVIISAYDNDERQHLAVNSKLGMVSDYIVKPFTEDHLIDTLQRIIELKDGETMREILRERLFGRGRQSQ